MSEQHDQDRADWLRMMKQAEKDRKLSRASIVFHAAIDAAILLALAGIYLRMGEIISQVIQ